MHKINEREVTAEGCDWGVEYHDPTATPSTWVYEAEDETEARQVAAETRGQLVARDVYVTAYAAVDEVTCTP